MAQLTVSLLQEEVRLRFGDFVKEHTLDGVVVIVFKETPSGIAGIMACAGYRGVKAHELLPLVQKQAEDAIKQLKPMEGVGHA